MLYVLVTLNALSLVFRSFISVLRDTYPDETAVCCMIVGNICIRTRLPPTLNKRAVIDLKIFRDARLIFTTLGIFSIEIVLFGTLGLMPSYVSSQGFSGSSGSFQIAVMNGGSCFGRVVGGILADAFGRFNMMIIMMVTALSICLVVWLPSGQHESLLYLFSVLFGFVSGYATYQRVTHSGPRSNVSSRQDLDVVTSRMHRTNLQDRRLWEILWDSLRFRIVCTVDHDTDWKSGTANVWRKGTHWVFCVCQLCGNPVFCAGQVGLPGMEMELACQDLIGTTSTRVKEKQIDAPPRYL